MGILVTVVADFAEDTFAIKNRLYTKCMQVLIPIPFEALI